MDEDFRNRLTDYFTATELVDVLGLTAEQLISGIEEIILEKQAELEEFMSYGC